MPYISWLDTMPWDTIRTLADARRAGALAHALPEGVVWVESRCGELALEVAGSPTGQGTT